MEQQIDWFKQFGDSVKYPEQGQIKAFVVSETSNESGDGHIPHHHVYLKKLITTEEEARLYFIQLLKELHTVMKNPLFGVVSGILPPGDWAVDQARTVTLAIDEILKVVHPNSVLQPQKQSDLAQQTDFWLTRYQNLLFSNEYVKVARYIPLPPTLKFWAE